MPPLNGIDRGMNGDVLKELWEIGHGARIVVVDTSYHVPYGSKVVKASGDSTSELLQEMFGRVPMDSNEAILMKSDKQESCPALVANLAVTASMEVDAVAITPEGEPEAIDELERQGFYAIANDPELRDRTLFVKTNDEQAFACGMFVVGHAQG